MVAPLSPLDISKSAIMCNYLELNRSSTTPNGLLLWRIWSLCRWYLTWKGVAPLESLERRLDTSGSHASGIMSLYFRSFGCRGFKLHIPLDHVRLSTRYGRQMRHKRLQKISSICSLFSFNLYQYPLPDVNKGMMNIQHQRGFFPWTPFCAIQCPLNAPIKCNRPGATKPTIPIIQQQTYSSSSAFLQISTAKPVLAIPMQWQWKPVNCYPTHSEAHYTYMAQTEGTQIQPDSSRQ